ncbi:hypothetical protein K435DRAFT_779390 [Dendrothele bispora CBS 962.96]|uniref:NADH dehydrogenase [ubiquinone] 1 alpha subcomplex subunit n=1 Tax=Dendrothele bispora (strain CBS 962.96) TaxID=1314807 RepID=A0A4S8KXP6_DENBC|nr:hypothetical protein K435DRAFT_785319 [Dendrothele bispora CBS 962.96]THU94527.1 hypothetical protein K435DRAFT_779390 [Dendrothele bispora CBS 962.96]
MSLLLRLWQRIRHPTGFVGYDLEGNAYYERFLGGDRRTKRMVQYKKGEDMWSYVGGQRRLPIQWTAWLAHTRPSPPTLQELQHDLLRQQRVLHNARLLEAADLQQQREIEIQQQKQKQVLNAPDHEPLTTTTTTAETSSSDPGVSSSSSSSVVSKLSQYHVVVEEDSSRPGLTSDSGGSSGSGGRATAGTPTVPTVGEPSTIPKTRPGPGPSLVSSPSSASRSPVPPNRESKPLPTVAGKDEYQPESWNPAASARPRVRRGR